MLCKALSSTSARLSSAQRLSLLPATVALRALPQWRLQHVAAIPGFPHIKHPPETMEIYTYLGPLNIGGMGLLKDCESDVQHAYE
jgi:hypothetical protein